MGCKGTEFWRTYVALSVEEKHPDCMKQDNYSELINTLL
jgi:hypothetical protein